MRHEWQRPLGALPPSQKGFWVLPITKKTGALFPPTSTSNLNLDEIMNGIAQAFDFDFEHLYRFIYKDHLGRIFEFTHPFADLPPNTSDFRLGDLPLNIGNHLQLTYDLLDEWEFDLQLEKIEPANVKIEKFKILQSHGKSPAQYGEEEYL